VIRENEVIELPMHALFAHLPSSAWH